MNKLIPCLLLLFVTAVSGQQSPEKTLASLKAAPGLELTLFAAEPVFSNPTNLTVDERGRVWVLEGVNYRRQSRKQPDFRPAGDRIVILEDTDQDGKSDKVKVFDQNPDIRVPLGIAVLGDKVFVSQAPDLIVYTKDASDNIIKKEVLLTGFGGPDHDHGLHAVAFGPDGRYYFNQGNTGYDVTDKSGKRVVSEISGANVESRPGYFQGIVLRMNPDGTNMEVLAQNFRNPYEVAVDSFGNIVQTDNDDDGNAMTRFNYVMEGGNYGFRGPLHRTWVEDRGTHWHLEVPGVAPMTLRLGAGSPCGLVVYEGKLLPEKYRGHAFHAEAGKRIVAMYPMTVDGAGFTARSEDLMNGGDDTWSRPSDVAVAPDGSLYIADWYDPGVGGHQMGDPEGGAGRIYRLAPAKNRPQVAKLDLSSAPGLTAAFGSPNQSTQYVAYMAIKNQGPAALPLLQSMWKQNDAVLKARALWILGGLGEPGTRAVQEALSDNDPRFRILGLRVAKLHGANILEVAKPLLRDRSPQVRREIALLLRDPTKMLPAYAYPEQVQPSAEWLDAMVQLISQYDGKDRWYLEAIGIGARGREDALYARLKSQNASQSSGAVQQVVWAIRPKSALPDLVAKVNSASTPTSERITALETLGSMQWPEAARAVESFIVDASTPPALAERAFGLYSHQLFSLWMDARKSPALPAVMRKAFTLPGAQGAAVTVAEALGDGQYMPELLTLAKSSTAGDEARATAIESLAYTRNPQYLKDFQALAESGPAPVRVAALRGLYVMSQPAAPAQGGGGAGAGGRGGRGGGAAQPPAAATAPPSTLAPPTVVPGVAQAPVSIPWAQKLVLSNAPNEVRTEALRLLSTSPEGLNAILDMAEKGSLPPELRSSARNLTNNATPPVGGRRGGAQSPVTMRQAPPPPTDPAYIAIRERAAKIMPMPPTKRIPSSFELDLSYRGVVADGRKWFSADAGCAACHSLGGKKLLGPDLSKIGAKYGKQAMLDSILNPNDAVQFEYVTTTFTLNNGDQVTGLVTEETQDRIVVQTGADQTQRLRPSDVKSKQESQISSMPEGLLQNLSLQQIADLLDFLATLK